MLRVRKCVGIRSRTAFSAIPSDMMLEQCEFTPPEVMAILDMFHAAGIHPALVRSNPPSRFSAEQVSRYLAVYEKLMGIVRAMAMYGENLRATVPTPPKSSNS